MLDLALLEAMTKGKLIRHIRQINFFTLTPEELHQDINEGLWSHNNRTVVLAC
jgi:hypothetical protein